MKKTLSVLPVLALPVFALSACGADEDDVRAASTNAVAAAEAAEINAEYKKTQDFDAIAKESVQGVDTTGFDALGQ